MAATLLVLDCTEEPSSGIVFVNAIKRCAPDQLQIDVHRLAKQYSRRWLEGAKNQEYQGIVISGSAAGVHDQKDWVDSLMEDLQTITTIPTFGICFGHQLLAQVWGGQVTAKSFETKVKGIRRVSQYTSPWQQQANTVEALFSHRDQVVKAPANWEVIASSDYCEIQALQATTMPIWTVQWHPEADAAFMAENPSPPWGAVDPDGVANLDGNQILIDFLKMVAKAQ